MKNSMLDPDPAGNAQVATQRKVSVAIPTYNRAYIVSESIESVLAQTYQNFELIVVDDGSKDNTREVISRFADSRIRYIRHETNRGCSAAYNTALRESAGELITILDSDDLWKPERLAKVVDFLERHPEADAVFTDQEKQEGSRFFPSHVRQWCPHTVSLLSAKGCPKELVFTQKEMYLCLLQEFPFTLQSSMLRRGALKRVGYLDESWPSASDWDFMLRFSKQHRFGYIDEPLTVLRVQSDATHHIHALAGRSRMIAMLQAEFKRAQDPEARKLAKIGYCYKVRQLSWFYLNQGERGKAFWALAQGFLTTWQIELLASAAYTLIRRRRSDVRFADGANLHRSEEALGSDPRGPQF